MDQIKSTSLVTGSAYVVPDSSDEHALNEFVQSNQGKKIVAVQGLGFVGTVMSLVVANSDQDEYAVLGLDLATSNSYWKIAEINVGICPIVSSDPLVSEFFENAKQKNNFYATYFNNITPCRPRHRILLRYMFQ